MAFDLSETLKGKHKFAFGGFLGLLHEGMKDGDYLSTAVAVEGSTDARAAFGPELKQAVAHGLGVGCPELGSVVFQQVQQLIAAGQQVDRPGLDLLADAGAVVLDPKRRFHVSARATHLPLFPSPNQIHRQIRAAVQNEIGGGITQFQVELLSAYLSGQLQANCGSLACPGVRVRRLVSRSSSAPMAWMGVATSSWVLQS